MPKPQPKWGEEWYQAFTNARISRDDIVERWCERCVEL